MTNLSFLSLLAVTLIITLMMGILMVILGRKSAQIKGPGIWAVGSFVLAVGILINLSAESTGYNTLFLLSGTFNLTGMGLYYMGILEYKASSRSRKIHFSFVAGYLVLGGFFVYVIHEPSLRMAIFSFVSIIYAILIIREFSRPPAKPYNTPFLFGLLVFSIHGLTHLARMAYLLRTALSGADDPTFPTSILFFSTSVTQSLLLFVFIILITTRIVQDLEKEVQNRNLLFSTVAHDLRGPIGGITEYLRFINTDKELDQEAREKFLKKVESLSGSTYNLLLNLLHWTASNLDNFVLKYEKVNISDLLQKNYEYFFSIAEEKGVKIIPEIANDCFATADGSMVDAIIRNLISNAIKFSHTGETVTLRTIEETGRAGFAVIDTGTGIKQETIEHALSGNFTQSTPGTDGEQGSGLGLMMIGDFTRKNRGEISIHSERSKGTEVIITFPLEA